MVEGKQRFYQCKVPSSSIPYVPSRRSGLQKKRATFEVFDLQNTRFNYKIDPIIPFEEQALGGAVLTNPQLYFRYRSQLATNTPRYVCLISVLVHTSYITVTRYQHVIYIEARTKP